MFDMGEPDSYADSYEFQVPIFVVTHTPPATAPRQNDRLTFTFVTDGVESALRQARAAAGDKDVTVIGGVDVARQCLHSGLVDELDLAIVPVLLGDGLRFFDRDSVEGIELGRPRVRDVGGVVFLTYPIIRQKKG
jgi:dihydrofolate reductase